MFWMVSPHCQISLGSLTTVTSALFCGVVWHVFAFLEMTWQPVHRSLNMFQCLNAIKRQSIASHQWLCKNLEGLVTSSCSEPGHNEPLWSSKDSCRWRTFTVAFGARVWRASQGKSLFIYFLDSHRSTIISYHMNPIIILWGWIALAKLSLCQEFNNHNKHNMNS